MTVENIVVIDGVEVNLETLPERDRLIETLNTEALRLKNYEIDKTA